MEANLTRSQATDRPRTRKTESLTLEQAREILQQSLIQYERMGGEVHITAQTTPLTGPFVGVLLFGCDLIEGRIVSVGTSGGMLGKIAGVEDAGKAEITGKMPGGDPGNLSQESKSPGCRPILAAAGVENTL